MQVFAFNAPNMSLAKVWTCAHAPQHPLLPQRALQLLWHLASTCHIQTSSVRLTAPKSPSLLVGLLSQQFLLAHTHNTALLSPIAVGLRYFQFSICVRLLAGTSVSELKFYLDRFVCKFAGKQPSLRRSAHVFTHIFSSVCVINAKVILSISIAAFLLWIWNEQTGHKFNCVYIPHIYTGICPCVSSINFTFVIYIINQMNLQDNPSC